MPNKATISRSSRIADDAPGLVAVLNNRADFERAESEHWYRIHVATAPESVTQANAIILK
jgi:hypothetical protein